jgi:cephalosporin-C deacetylase-like acetyl esterase
MKKTGISSAVAVGIFGLAAVLSGGIRFAALGSDAVPSWRRGEGLNLRVLPDHPDGLYAGDERAVFTVTATRGGKPVADGEVAFRVTTPMGVSIADAKAPLKDGTATMTATMDKPGFVLCEAAFAAAGEHSMQARCGAGFDVLKIAPATALPDDFDAFWAAARKERDAIPADLKLTKMEAESSDKADVFKISLANINNTRIYGYLAVPKGRKGPFPAQVYVPGAGTGVTDFSSEARGATSAIATRHGAIGLLVNVHDFDIQPYDGEPVNMQKVYNDSYSRRGAPDAKNYYFYRAILGIDRAIDYLAGRPDWDGKHMVMKGGSQGGGFTLILTGLNQHVTAAAASVAGMCDHAGYRAGHAFAWPRLIPRDVQMKDSDEERKWLKFAAYFDAVNFARNIKCPTIMGIGLLDESGRPGPNYAAYNLIKGPKRMFTGPDTGHAAAPAYAQFVGGWIEGQLGVQPPVAPCHEPAKIDSVQGSQKEDR